MIFLIYFYVLLIGITIGSFLNVVIYRVPSKISIAKGRSFCPNCKKTIHSYDLIPILSYLFLGGKCRNCKSRISLRYPLIELLTGLFAIISVYCYGLNFGALLYFAFFTILLCIAMIDFDTMTIPDCLILSLIPLAVASIFLFPQISIISRIIGFFAISLPMYGLIYFIENAFGGGDIKLFAILGFILGWQNTLLCFFIAAVLAAILGTLLLIIKKENYKGKQIPFGPYICIGALISMLFGQIVIRWYLSFF